MPSKVWFRHLARNRFQFDWNRLHIVLGVSCFMPGSDLLSLLQHLLFGKAIAKAQLAAPPLFVLGHWRSGTTLLHELLTLDTKFASPTTFECFAPSHFLLTEGLVTRFGGWLLPNKRPMDNMKAGWALPQEDEFALMNLGAPTPYAHIMFPQHDFVDENTLSSEEFTPEQLHQWKRLFDWFLRALTYKSSKPLILKSPPHTGRIQILRDMYPDAKFIHIARDPRKLYPSTMKLWKSLEAVQGLQRPTDPQRLSEFVLRSLESMYRSFEAGRRDLPESQIIDVRYEELVANPVEVIGRIYRQLNIGDFESVRGALMARSDSEKEYQTNRFGLEPEIEELVMSRWSSYAERYGYGA